MTPTRDTARPDRGMISAYVACIATALLFVAGAVFDGGRFVNTYGEASDLAGNAARAAAQATDRGELYRGVVVIDAADAEHRAAEFLQTANPDAGVQVSVAGNTVTVTVSLTVAPHILPIGTRTIEASATATAQRGVEQPTGAP